MVFFRRFKFPTFLITALLHLSFLSLYLYITFHSVFANITEKNVIVTTDLRYPIKDAICNFNFLWIENIGMPFWNVGQIPIYHFMCSLSQIIDYYFMMKLYVLSPLVIGYFGIYLLLRYVISISFENYAIDFSIRTHLLIIVASALFLMNPTTILFYVNNTPMAIGYSSSPWLIYLFLKLVNEPRYTLVYPLALFFLLSLSQFHTTLLSMIMLIIFVLSRLLVKRKFENLPMGTLVIISSIFFILPLIFPFFYCLSRYSLSNPIYTFDAQNMQWMYKDASLVNSINFINFPWEDKFLMLQNNVYLVLFYTSGIFLFAISCFCVFSSRETLRKLFSENGRTLIVFALSTLFLSLSLGSKIPFLYEKVVLPLAFIPFGWVFRDPSKWNMTSSLAISILLLFSIILMLNLTSGKSKNRHKLLFYISFILIIALILSRMAFIFNYTGSKINFFSPRKFERVNSFLHNENPQVDQYNKLVWLPCWYEIRYRDLGAISLVGGTSAFSTVPEINQEIVSSYFLNSDFVMYNDVSYIASLFGIKYIAIETNDLVSENLKQGCNKLVHLYMLDPFFEMVFECDGLYIFENKRYTSALQVMDYNNNRMIPSRVLLSNQMKETPLIMGKMPSETNFTASDNMFKKHEFLLIFDIKNLSYNYNFEYILFAKKESNYIAFGLTNDRKLLLEFNNHVVVSPRAAREGTCGILLKNTTLCFLLENEQYKMQLPAGWENMIFDTLLDSNNLYIGRSDIGGCKATCINNFWLYNTSKVLYYWHTLKGENETMDIRFFKVNPTLWQINVNSTKPIKLILAEPYDPSWIAKVYVDGKLIREVKSSKYEIINSFDISITGSFVVTIEYMPQYLYYISSILSVSAIVVYTACIFLKVKFNKFNTLGHSANTQIR